jgi:hypothetical protein
MVILICSDNEKLAAADGYPYKVSLYFPKDTYEINSRISAEFLLRKPHSQWHVKEMTVNWDGGSKVLMEDKTFLINEDRYKYGNGWYLVSSISGEFRLAKVNFEKIFRESKHGDQFPVKVFLRYSFDDEPETEQEFEFMVTTRKWEHTPVFFS